MSKAKVNTSKSIKGAKVSQADLDKQITKAATVLKGQKKKEVQIPAHLKSRLGSVVPVAVNGAVIHVPVGEKVKVPESMAEVLNDSLNQITL